eukprot:CAMPEP_0119387840 /NCGR_PEP_ID=MMETSP1334-20130426/102385_1 /TAXON_ID=127549 /ORGANISM="Calcidiscus leptoporus, Strain RCC1130" /LENGTH=60 /DNA_ID=CAMNT_0007409667 /DNA_START=130 /DNA_END=309 /DNA_ORIENTATION=-
MHAMLDSVRSGHPEPKEGVVFARAEKHQRDHLRVRVVLRWEDAPALPRQRLRELERQHGR